MKERLKKIKTRAKALGWKYKRYYVKGSSMNGFTLDNPNGGSHTFHIDNIQAAERLLALYEPGAMVKVHKSDTVVPSLTSVVDGIEFIPTGIFFSHYNDVVPGTYKLIPVEVDDAAV